MMGSENGIDLCNLLIREHDIEATISNGHHVLAGMCSIFPWIGRAHCLGVSTNKKRVPILNPLQLNIDNTY